MIKTNLSLASLSPNLNNDNYWQVSRREFANRARLLILQMVYHASSGHLASALALADLFAVLFLDILKNNNQQNWLDNDHLLMSNGHAATVWYASLYLTGKITRQQLFSFRMDDGLLQGHTTHSPHLGLVGSSGSLGQGLSQASGLAYAKQQDGLLKHTYCIVSDAELQEGQTWEALQFIQKYQIKKLIPIIDQNNIQIEGLTTSVMPLLDIERKISDFGFQVFNTNGHNYQEIRDNLHLLRQSEKLGVILLHTVAGKGVSFMENQYIWHGRVPETLEYQQALLEVAAKLKEEK